MKNIGTKTLGTLLALIVGLTVMPAALSAQEPEAAAQDQPRQIQVTILGMSCPFCAYGAEQKLKRLEGVSELEIVLATGVATLTMEEGADVSNEVLQQSVKEAGFEAAKITRSFESEYPDYDAEDGS